MTGTFTKCPSVVKNSRTFPEMSRFEQGLLMLLLGHETSNRDILQMSLFYTGTFHVLTGTRGLIRNYEISQQNE